MTVEQFKQLRKNQKARRQDVYRLHHKSKQYVLKEAKKAGDKEMINYVMNWKPVDERLKLPRNTFTLKIREAFEELILNDVAATEGSYCNTSSMEFVEQLMDDMYAVTGTKPSSYCYFTIQDIPDFKKGSFFLGWGGDVDLIKSILEKNGLNVSYESENKKLLIEEK